MIPRVSFFYSILPLDEAIRDEYREILSESLVGGVHALTEVRFKWECNFCDGDLAVDERPDVAADLIEVDVRYLRLSD